MAAPANVSQIIKPSGNMTLGNIRKGKIDMPVRVLLFGLEGVGKSTWAAGAPSPIFLGAESGTTTMDIERFPEPQSWSDVMDAVTVLGRDKHDYKSLVVDPLNWLEPLVFQQVTGGTGTIEEFGGGFGKGYTAALDQWRLFLIQLERCWKRGMHVILTAHSHVKSFQNPEGPAYDRYEIAMNQKASGLFKQWCDFVLFARLESSTRVDPATKKAKGYSTGARILHTQWTAAYDAKSRLKLPEEMDLSWDSFWSAIQAESGRAAELLVTIAKLSEEIGDEKVSSYSKDFTEKHKGHPDRLAELANRLTMKLDEKKKEQSK